MEDGQLAGGRAARCHLEGEPTASWGTAECARCGKGQKTKVLSHFWRKTVGWVGVEVRPLSSRVEETRLGTWLNGRDTHGTRLGGTGRFFSLSNYFSCPVAVPNSWDALGLQIYPVRKGSE